MMRVIMQSHGRIYIKFPHRKQMHHLTMVPPSTLTAGKRTSEADKEIYEGLYLAVLIQM